MSQYIDIKLKHILLVISILIVLVFWLIIDTIPGPLVALSLMYFPIYKKIQDKNKLKKAEIFAWTIMILLVISMPISTYILLNWIIRILVFGLTIGAIYYLFTGIRD